MKILSVLGNFAIFVITLIVLLRAMRPDGRLNREKTRWLFRFFTVQSNVLSAAAALVMGAAQLFGEVSRAVWLFKYIGTAAVTVTLLTVMLYLAPSMGGLKKLISGGDLYMHLICPLLAILTFSFLEKKPMSFTESLAGMLPVLLYGALYLYKIRFAPQEKRWDDFYGFNRGGKWPVSFMAMAAGTFLICVGLKALQNLV